MSFLIKVLWSGKEIVFRDLKASKQNSLLELHDAILSSFGLSGDQMAGFTKVDDELQIEVDYQLEAFDENSSLMADVQLEEVFSEVGDVLDYTYDFLNDINFSLELMEVSDEKVEKIQKLKSHGDLPKDLMKEIDNEDAQSILIQAMLGDEESYEEEEDLFDNEDFESLDDYEGLY